MSTRNEDELVGMSDEDFLNSFDDFTEEGDDITRVEEEEVEGQAEEETPAQPEPEEEAASAQAEEPFSEEGEEEDKPEASDDQEEEAEEAAEEEEQKEDEEEKSEEDDSEDPKAAEYKAFYDKVMAPFTANGREIKLDSADDVIQLMQMGANYTKKLQALGPHRKMIQMLENNNLLDEGKLNFLIDLEKRDPTAIQKFLRDANIDPMDIDTSAEPEYVPNKHKVSDNEIAFRETVESLSVTPEGPALIREIDQKWDQSSKNEIWQNPELLTILAEHRKDGVFEVIASEVDRQRALGYDTNLPFIKAYLKVGNALKDQGRLTTSAPTQENTGTVKTDPRPAQQVQTGRVLDQRTAPRKKPDPAATKARAASAPKPARKTVKQEINPLSLSDEEFEKIEALGAKF